MLAWQQYANEFQYIVKASGKSSSSYKTFIQLILSGDNSWNTGYLTNPKVLVCTSNFYADLNSVDLATSQKFYVTYAIDCFEQEENNSNMTTLGVKDWTYYTGKEASPFCAGIDPAKCRYASQVMVVADAACTKLDYRSEGYGGCWEWSYAGSGSSTEGIHLVHSGRATVGFVDGSAKAMKAEAMNTDTAQKPTFFIQADGLSTKKI